MKLVWKFFLTIACMIGFAHQSIAQDPVYSHAFMAPVYLNPAATGLSDYDFRVSAIYRRQWLLVPSGMQYFSVAAEKFFTEHNAAAAIMVNSEREGYVKSLSVHGTFSKLLCMGNHQLNLGIQAGIFNRRIDYSKLWFADQINNEGIITNLPSQVSPNFNNNRWRPDFAAGFMWMHNRGIMIGGSVHHINQNDESFTNSQESKLPRRLTFTGRWTAFQWQNALWDDDVLLMPGILYSKQRKNETFSMGAEIKTHYLNLGLWYRMNMEVRRSDAFFITITLDNFLGRSDNMSAGSSRLRMGGAYDATTNAAGFSRTAGSSEGALIWEHLFNEDGSAENRCRAKSIPCPRFKNYF